MPTSKHRRKPGGKAVQAARYMRAGKPLPP
jgi:hypothetical protein